MKKLIRISMIAFLAIGLGTSTVYAQCYSCINNPDIILTNGGTLTTSGIQNSTPGTGFFTTTGPYCIRVDGGTLVVDEHWFLNGVCIALAFGANIEVAPGIVMDMQGGSIFDPFATTMNGGVTALAGASIDFNGVAMESATTAIRGEGSSLISFENGSISSSETAVSADNCSEVRFNNNSCIGLNLAVRTKLTPTVTVTGNYMSGAGANDGFVQVAESTTATINNNPMSAGSQFGPVTGIWVSSSTNATMTGNNISINGCKWGIFAALVDNLAITGNDLFFTKIPGSGIIVRGVQISSCPSISFNGNDINTIIQAAPGGGALANLDKIGLNIQASSGSVIGNTITNSNIGVHIQATCGLAENFRQNQFNGQMDVGLLVDPGSSMGTQTCTHNLWNGFFNINGAKNLNVPPSEQFFVSPFGFQMPPNSDPAPPIWFVPSNCPMFGEEGGGTSGRSSAGEGKEGPIQTKEVKISPNPVNGILQVSLPQLEESCDIELRDLAGKLVYKSIVAPSQTLTELDVSSVSPGLYLLTVHSGNLRHTEKVAISR